MLFKKTGFVTAVGTPLSEDGSLVAESFVRQIKDQIDGNAMGILAMGTMGMEVYVPDQTYPDVARAAVSATDGAVPVVVGAMDNSCRRVLDRIECLKSAGADGAVVTTPYYHPLSQEEVIDFFTTIARSSPLPIFIYDLPVVTKTQVLTETVATLMKVPNIVGIKSGNLKTCKEISHHPERSDRFEVLFSGIDLFDVAYQYGITGHLDGMFACSIGTTTALYRHLEYGDIAGGRRFLAKILELRDTMASFGIFPAFTSIMNNLGYSGTFHPDYMNPVRGNTASLHRLAAQVASGQPTPGERNKP